MRFRFVLLILFFTVLYGLLGFRLYRIQIVKSNFYIDRARAVSEVAAQLELRRGQIFFTDRYEKPISVSVNRDYPVIYAVPRDIKDLIATSKVAAVILGIDEESLRASFSDSKSLFKLLVERATDNQVKEIRRAKIAGVDTDKKQYRFYSFERLASQLLGFVGLNNKHANPIGLYGVEKIYDDILADGGDVKLTIDRNLQAESERILGKLVEEYKASGGTIIIQEPKTGKILTLANAPDFDPNQYSKSPVRNFLNPAVQYVYEPGSVFKPLTMSAGIESGVLTPETTFTDYGKVILNGKTVQNWDHKAYGKITMTNVIERSVNTGAIYAESLIGNEQFLSYLKKFGFGEKTDIDLPDEARGSLKNLEKKDARAIDFATASFGQGTAVTPIQLISAFSSIANGGLLMRPYINQELGSQVIRRVISETTAREVTKMMESAVEKAKIAAIPGFRIAGKTGTAQVPDFEKGGYTDQYIHSYVGFAPASQPRFVILIKLDRPDAELAGFTVVPVFHELAQFVLSYYNVPPDNLVQE